MAGFTIKVYDQHTRREIPVEERDAYDSYSVALCDVDGTRVYFANPGTAETAHCERYHRWQQAFASPDQNGCWIELE